MTEQITIDQKLRHVRLELDNEDGARIDTTLIAYQAKQKQLITKTEFQKIIFMEGLKSLERQLAIH